MKWKWQHIIRQVMAALLCLSICVATPAMAQQTKQKEPGAISVPQPGSDSKRNCRDKYEGKLLAVVVPCIRDLVQETTEYITDQFDELLKAAATAFAVLVVTLFGLKAMTQEGDIKKEGFILLMKIGFVFLFMDNFGGFIPAAFGTVKDSVDMVTSTLGSGNYQCDMSGFPGEAPWNYLDCVLGTLFGFAPNMVIGSSVFGVLGSMWSGQFGSSLFMAGIFMLFFIVTLILRATYTYLMAIIILGFLIIISPLLIPLLMLKATFQYFEHWLRATISVALQPMIMMAYVTLVFSILDQMMFDDQRGLAKLMPPEQVEKWLNPKGGHKQSASFGDRKGHDLASGRSNVDYSSESVLKTQYPVGTGAAAQNWWSEMTSVDLRENRASTTQNIFFSMAALAIMAYLLSAMLDSILQIAQMMFGGGFALAQAVGTSENPNPIEAKFQQAQKSIGQGATSIGDAIKGMVSGGRR